jgi:hypothetical protein
MTDDLVKRLRQWDCGESTWELLESAADRIEKLETSEAEWQPICDSYAAENGRFSDRIEKLDAALRELLSLGEWGTSALARTIILEALDEKD